MRRPPTPAPPPVPEPPAHKTTRRAFLGAAASATLVPALSPRLSPARQDGVLVNDVHAKLNATRVARIARPGSRGELQEAIGRAGRAGDAISIAGGRHAMGGQQFGAGTTLLDTRSMNGVLGFDQAAGVVEVEAGMQWPELVAWLEGAQIGVDRPWGIVQKQTGADRLSLGGALSANVHGRGLRLRPIIQDIESFALVDAGGERRTCSRTDNRELFSLAIGGYGLFGAIGSVRLRLARRHQVERIVELVDVEELGTALEERIAAGFEFGDFQFATGAADERFLRRGVFSCYRPVARDTPVPRSQKEFGADAWGRLAYLAHTDPARAFEEYAAYYLSTNGQIYGSDSHQMSYYQDDYHVALSRRLGHTGASSEMITEIYVPPPALAAFMATARDALRRRAAELIYGTVRWVERDDESYLAWAREPWACVIFNLHVDHSDAGLAAAADAFRDLIDAGLAYGGSYYLTYHRWARREQVLAAHPRIVEFLREKRRHDPDERFQSDWYRLYRRVFAAELS